MTTCESSPTGSSRRARPWSVSSATTSAAGSFRSGARRGRRGYRITAASSGPSSRSSTTARIRFPFFTQAHRVPLGVNMAFRREAFDRAGLWDNSVGRRKGTLLGQEVREWMFRARAAGLRGSYAPSMAVRHVIQGDRLNKRYFRRWYYWNGISRALLYRNAWIDMQAPESTDLDFSRVPHILGVPALLLSQGGARAAPHGARSAWRGDARRRASTPSSGCGSSPACSGNDGRTGSGRGRQRTSGQAPRSRGEA